MKNVIFLGRFRFPNENAAAKRVLTMGCILRELGYNVIFYGDNEEFRKEDFTKDGTYMYKGFRYFKRTRVSSNKIIKSLNFYTNYTYFMNELDELKLDKGDIVFTYHMSSVAALLLNKWCVKNNFVHISDVTEWYEIFPNIVGILRPWFLDSEIRMRLVHRKISNLVVISKFLQRYYVSKGCNVIRIPMLSDEKTEYKNKNHDLALNSFCYSGNPSNKDLIDVIINAFVKLSDYRKDFYLHIAGISREEYLMKYNVEFTKMNIIDSFTVFHGQIPHKMAQDLVRNSNFTVLLRPNKRYAEAGFPSKVTESLSLGTPVVLNITSDLSDFIRDKYNGIIVKGFSEVDLVDALEEACLTTIGQREQMMRNCIDFANSNLHYNSYKIQLEKFLDQIEYNF